MCCAFCLLLFEQRQTATAIKWVPEKKKKKEQNHDNTESAVFSKMCWKALYYVLLLGYHNHLKLVSKYAPFLFSV